MPKLDKEFFAHDPRIVARKLMGMRLVREIKEMGEKYIGIIAETGAYQGGNRDGLRYGPGIIYVPIFQGGHATLAIGTEKEGTPSVVTIRKVYPVEGITEQIKGPGDLARAFKITRDLDKKPIDGDELYIIGEPFLVSRVKLISPKDEKMSANCLGYYRIM